MRITKAKLTIQLAVAVFLSVAGMVLIFCGFWVEPTGEIDNSVLVAYGEVSGISYEFLKEKRRKMKTIDAIIIHCSATRAGQDLRAKDIDRMHRARGFNQIGYNFVIDLDGTVENGRPLSIADWMPMANRLIPVRKHRKTLCVIWWQSSARSTQL